MKKLENFQEFESLIKKDKYQVFVFCCPALFPFNFFRHPWFVLNKKGEISRWEIRHDINLEKHNHLFINNQHPFQGINTTYFVKNYFWKAKLLGYLEGDENSTIKGVIDFIENSKENYPYCNRYFGLGPNSNTYLQWVLNNFPEFNVKLSWRFIGKNFKINN